MAGTGLTGRLARGEARPHKGTLKDGQQDRLSGDRQLHQSGEDLLTFGVPFIAFTWRSQQFTRIMAKRFGIGGHEHPDSATGVILNGKLALDQVLHVAIERPSFRPGSAFQPPIA